MDFQIGQTAGDYQIIAILGAGGMGKVYKVRNVISDRIEAMKVLLPDLANESELADRFMREIKLLASLNHPNIAALHTALRLDNQFLMVMEYVEGQALDERLKAGRIPVREAAGYIAQTLSALAFAHERGVVHRDIKPANMMVTPDGQVKLMDFGIAKAVADRRLTQTGATLGSLFYMSPEQVKGSADLDGRSDIYSVGVALYELVTGARPFKGDSDYSIMVAHLEQKPIPPIEVDSSVPPELNEIILAAIEKDPANRFQTAQAFRAALESVMGTLGPAPAPRPGTMRVTATAAPVASPIAPPVAPPPAARAQAPQAPPPKSGHRGLWMGLGAVVAIAVLVVAAMQFPKWTGTKASAPAQEAAAPAKPAAQPAAVPEAPAAAAPEPAAQPASPTAPAPAPPVVQAHPPARTLSAAPASRPVSHSASAEVQVQPSVPIVSQPAPAAPQTPQTPAVDTAALEEVREGIDRLAPRVIAIRTTLSNLEQEQRRQGVGLRGDISASWKRMEGLLDDAEAALKSGDATRSKRALDQAEREADKLDKFLGR